MKDYQTNLRFKHMVARLQGLSAQKQEEVLMQEIAKGRRWRIDAAVTAIENGAHSLHKMDTLSIFSSLGMHGRLFGIHRLSTAMGLKAKQGNSEFCAPEFQAAFDRAVIHDHYRIANFCAARGAFADKQTGGRNAPHAMAVAIENKDVKKVHYLLDKGAAADDYLPAAIIARDMNLVQLFIERGAQVNAPSGHQGQMSPLMQAVAYGTPEIADYLITQGADVEAQGDDLLLYAIAQGKPIVDKFIALGLSPNARHLFEAVSLGKLDVAQSFVDLGLAVDAAKLHVAIVSKDPDDKIAFCLRNGADAADALEALRNQPGLYQHGGRDKIIATLEDIIGKTAPKALHRGPKR